MLQPLLDPTQFEALSTLWANTMIAVSLKAIPLLAFAWLGTWLLRRRAAATRHAVWTASALALLLMPILSLALPSMAVAPVPDWRLQAKAVEDTADGLHADALFVDPTEQPTDSFRVRPADASPARVFSSSRTANPSDEGAVRAPHAYLLPSASSGWTESTGKDAVFVVEESRGTRGESWATPLVTVLEYLRDSSWKTWSLLAWELGALLVLGFFAVGSWRVSRLERECHELVDETWHSSSRAAARAIGLRRVPRLLWTSQAWTPLTLGTWRPTVILPDRARGWSESQRREVLLHEFAHVQRRDILTQSIAQLACALFWFHPLPWIAAGRMRLERERACDDRVLMAGSRASTYASHLLEMARSLRFESPLATASVAMARRSQLGERVESLLDDRPRGRRMSGLARAGVVALTAALVLPLAAMAPAPTTVAAPTPPRWVHASSPDRPSEVHRPHAPHRVRVPRAPRVVGFRLRDDDRDQGDYTIRWDHGNFQSNDDQREWRVSAQGTLRFAPTEDRIEWMEEGSYFELEFRDRETKTRRRIEFDGHGDEGFDVHYTVNSQTQPYDDEAKSWFAEALPEFFDRSAVIVRSRTQRWLDEGGIDAAIAGLERIEGPWALGIYSQALLERLDDSADRRRVVTSVIERLDSGFSRSNLLQMARPDFVRDDESAALWLHWVGELDNDFAVAQSLQGLTESGSLTPPVVALALQSSGGLESEFMKGQVLIALVPYVAEDAELTEAFYRVADELESDFQYERVLHALQRAQQKGP